LLLEDGDGLIMYRRFAGETPAVLKTGGRLLVETGYDQHPAVLEIFKNADGWQYIGSHRNPNDACDRVAEFAYNK